MVSLWLISNWHPLNPDPLQVSLALSSSPQSHGVSLCCVSQPCLSLLGMHANIHTHTHTHILRSLPCPLGLHSTGFHCLLDHRLPRPDLTHCCLGPCGVELRTRDKSPSTSSVSAVLSCPPRIPLPDPWSPELSRSLPRRSPLLMMRPGCLRS